MLCEGPNSANNHQALVFGTCSSISRKTSSSTAEGLLLPSLKCLNLFCTTCLLTIPGFSFVIVL